MFKYHLCFHPVRSVHTLAPTHAGYCDPRSMPTSDQQKRFGFDPKKRDAYPFS